MRIAGAPSVSVGFFDQPCTILYFRAGETTPVGLISLLYGSRVSARLLYAQKRVFITIHHHLLAIRYDSITKYNTSIQHIDIAHRHLPTHPQVSPTQEERLQPILHHLDVKEVQGVVENVRLCDGITALVAEEERRLHFAPVLLSQLLHLAEACADLSTSKCK